MANEIVNLNGTPKLAKGSVFQYFFGPGLIFQADPATDSYIQVGPNVSTLHPVAFADITDKLGASDIEEYLDQVALQGLMSVVGTGGGGGTGGGELVSGATPPADTTKKWFNTGDNLIYYYDGSNWLSEQLFSVEFNDQGTTPNNTFFRVGNTVTTDDGVGYNIPFLAQVISLSFNRAPNTAQLGNYWLYSNSVTGTQVASVIATFTVPNTSARGLLNPQAPADINADSYVSIRWNGQQTNNNIVSLNYRKKYQ